MAWKTSEECRAARAKMAGRPRLYRSPEEWAEIRALYRAGMTTPALAAQFGANESTIRTHLRRRKCLRKDQAEATCPLDAEALGDRVRETKGCAADAPVRALGAGASLAEAARAAAETAIRMLREAEPTRACTYARLAGTLEKLARGTAGDGSLDGTERGRQAALDVLRREGVI